MAVFNYINSAYEFARQAQDFWYSSVELDKIRKGNYPWIPIFWNLLHSLELALKGKIILETATKPIHSHNLIELATHDAVRNIITPDEMRCITLWSDAFGKDGGLKYPDQAVDAKYYPKHFEILSSLTRKLCKNISEETKIGLLEFKK